MHQDRTRQGRALSAPDIGRLIAAATGLRRRVASGVVLLAAILAGGLPSGLSAQFPPPARPPKVGGEVQAPGAAKPSTPAASHPS